ncbi:MAG: hypothetical protein JW888_02795, partial [Pirellulales bacterium]|nr:hypothetical protein [Pirellulales bacterium]
MGHVYERFAGRRPTLNVTERSFRRLVVDPLEARQLLSVSPMGPNDQLVNQSYVGDLADAYEVWDQDTLSGQSVAVDDDGDFVVTWTRYDLVIDPDTGDYVIDPITGFELVESNVYARYFTDEVQRVALPTELGVDNVAGSAYGKFSLTVGGNEVQKLTITSSPEPYWPEYYFAEVSGTFSVGFDVNGNGSIGPGERFTMIYDELTIQANEDMMQAGLRGLGGALADVEVAAIAPNEFYIYFGDQSGGVDQPEIYIDPAFTSWTTGFYPAAMISTVNEPVTIANIPVHSTDPEITARVMEQMFLYTMQDYYQSPTFFPTEEEVYRDALSPHPQDDDHPEEFTFDYEAYTEPDTIRYADFRIAVTPVIDPDTLEYSLTTFDVTFIDESGKTNVPEMVIASATDDLGRTQDTSGISYLDPSNSSVTTIKESSPEFRVNDPEPDDPFTPWPDKTDQYQAAVTMDADGDFVITWTSDVAGEVNDTSLSDIYARRFKPIGWTADPSFVTAEGVEV